MGTGVSFTRSFQSGQGVSGRIVLRRRDYTLRRGFDVFKLNTEVRMIVKDA